MEGNYIKAVNYPLNRKEENQYIDNINSLLENLESLLTVDSADMNDLKIMQSSAICELMVNLLLRKRQYEVKKNTPIEHIIGFCKMNFILPPQCIGFLEIIEKYRNSNIHKNASGRFTSSFLKAFTNYISWFSINYPASKPFRINNCCAIIDSVYSFADDNTKFNSIHENAYRHFNEKINTIECPHCGFTLSRGDNFCVKCGRKIENTTLESIISDKISAFKDRYLNTESRHEKENMQYEYTPNMNIEDILNNLNARNDEIIDMITKLNQTVEGMDEKLDTILGQLRNVQSHTEKLIRTAVTEEEIDRIIEVHTNQCIENILEYNRNLSRNTNYYIEQGNLKELFAESWKKLSEDSKTFLITSKFMYNHLSQLDENFDYSGICVLTTKAMEVEIFKRFFTDFIDYLNEKYGNDYSKYHTALLHRNQKPLFPERFTMGNIAYVLCSKEKRTDTENEKVNNKIVLMEYCQNRLFSDYNEQEIWSTLEYYGKQIEIIKEKYRNPSAHRDQIKRVDARECLDLVLDVEKLLKQMLDSFDY